MKKIFLYILATIFLASCVQKKGELRTCFFPKFEKRIDVMPDKSNVWVFILAGQSNMAGYALVEPQDTLASDRILTINKNGDIIIAKEPLHFYEPSINGLDCGLSFGKTLLEHIPDSISILLIPTAIGGSSVSQWLNDSVQRGVRLLSNFREKVEIGKKYGQIKGILWHQGESDTSPEDIPLYKDRLSLLVKQFRKIAGNENLPFLAGELGSFSNSKPKIKINEQIRLFASGDSNTAVIGTSDLKDCGDNIHFSSEGERILGARFAIEYIRKYK